MSSDLAGRLRLVPSEVGSSWTGPRALRMAIILRARRAVIRALSAAGQGAEDKLVSIVGTGIVEERGSGH